MKKLIILIIINLFAIAPSFAVLMNSEMLDTKIELDNLYYEAAAKHKLSIKKVQRLNQIKANLDDTKKNNNSNVVPIYYKLGITYREIKRDNDAIDCFRTIVKYYPASPLRKKSLIYLKYYGEVIEENGMMQMLPYKEDDGKVENEVID